MRRTKPVLLCIFLIAQSLRGSAQSQVPDDVARAWTAYRSTHADEKIFVHTDKDFYLAGELCWFKCYDVSALTLKPLSLSRVAYVEILDTSARPVLQAKIALSAGGSGGGSLYLPFSLSSGVYTLRAYTRWMKNGPANFFFQKTLTLINTREAASPSDLSTAATTASSPDIVTFFPEGGNLVDGLASTVAFKGTNAYGDPIDFTGILVDEKGDTLLHFSPQALGMGRFSFTPSAGHSYSAHIATLTVPLPEAYPEGYVLHLDTTGGGQLRVSVRTNKTGEETVYLFVQTRGSLKMTEGKALSNGQAEFLIDKNALGEGISQLTVFNSDHQPVCERLYFTYPKDKAQLPLSVDRSEYSVRAPVKVTLSDTAANLSMSVYQLDSLQHTSPSNIYTYLWLSSDLTGPVADPGYYWDHPGTAIDDLMLTQGWRRFRWESVLHDPKPSFRYAPEYGGHLVTGTVIDSRTGAPAHDLQVFLSVPGKWTQFASAVSDSLGRVAFDMRNMYGSPEIIVQTNLSRDSLYRIDIDDPFSQEYPRRPLPVFREPLQNPVTLSDLSLSMQVQNAYAAMQQQQLTLDDIDTSAFYGHPDLTYKLDDYTRFTTMEEVLREYIQLVNVSRRGDHYHIWTFDAPHAVPFDDDPLTLLDGVPIFSLDQFMKYDPFKIRKVDVVTRRYFLGDGIYDGIVNWTTYKGDLSGYSLDPRVTAIDYEGLQQKREFYSPVYATDAQKASRLPDFRNVLYWNPSVTAGKAVQFYTSDMPGTYVVVLQGMSADGRPLYGTTTFTVR